jgi:type III secretion protein J
MNISAPAKALPPSRNGSRFLLYLLLLLVAIPLLTSCGSRRTIVNALDEKEANEILVFLSGKGIDASKTQSKEAGTGSAKITLWDISVADDQATQAMALLNQVGLPRRRGQNLLGIFASGGLVPSELQEQIRYQAGLAEQIASTIRKIDGVLDAEVQISFPKEDPLHPGAMKGKITASVYVKHSGVLDDPNSHLVSKIKRLVAASVTGLDYDNVTVIADRARYNEPASYGSTLGEEEKQYVHIWTLLVASESATRFRIIFFSFILIIFLCILAIIWLSWKLFPILTKHGGMKELFSLSPIGLEKKAEEPKKENKENPESPSETTDESSKEDKS